MSRKSGYQQKTAAMNGRILIVVLLGLLSTHCTDTSHDFSYQSENLTLTGFEVEDSLRKTTLQDIPEKTPKNDLVLTEGNDITKKLWKAALADVESNIVETPQGRYFGAGKEFGLLVYTRDISFSGVLALNELYPQEMFSSLKVTRDVRLALGLKVSKGYVVPAIKGNWQEEDISEPEFIREHKTNSYTRRTDDVIWLWAARDLFEKNPALADWDWLYDKGSQSFETLYWPFYDTSDGLFRGQSSFIDIHYTDNKATGYPQDFSVADCVLIKALSTNCLYYQGMLSMAAASERLGKSDDKVLWQERAEKLKQAILSQLDLGNGTFSYFKDKTGNLQPRRDALGSALLVLSGIVEGEDAKKCLAGYPESWAGIPILYPFFPWKTFYHNNTAWPFVDTFYLWAKGIAYGKDYTGYNAALLARTCFDGQTFRELVNFKTREPYRSASQLWTASSFLNVCLRKPLAMKQER